MSNWSEWKTHRALQQHSAGNGAASSGHKCFYPWALLRTLELLPCSWQDIPKHHCLERKPPSAPNCTVALYLSPPLPSQNMPWKAADLHFLLEGKKIGEGQSSIPRTLRCHLSVQQITFSSILAWAPCQVCHLLGCCERAEPSMHNTSQSSSRNHCSFPLLTSLTFSHIL